MQRIFFRTGIVAAAIGIAATGFAFHGGGAHAASLSVPLNPASGAASFGDGNASFDASGTSLIVRIDENGTRPGMIYRVSACANLGGQFACVSDANGDLVRSDPYGGVHGSVITPAPARTDVVTLVNISDANDAYQAWFAAATPVSPAIYPPVYPSLPYPYQVTTNGVIYVPFGATAYPYMVCPMRYVGPLTVVYTPYSTIGYVNFWTYYARAFYGIPYGAYTGIVYCA